MIVVEHDEEAILAADYVVDLGPGAGVHGGQVVFAGHAGDRQKPRESLTGQYLSGKRSIAFPSSARHRSEAQLEFIGATGNNLQGGRRGHSGRADDLRHRRVGLGQVDADQ